MKTKTANDKEGESTSASESLRFWLPSCVVLVISVGLSLAVWPDVLTRDLYHMRTGTHLGLDDLRPSAHVVHQVCANYILTGVHEDAQKNPPVASPRFLRATIALVADSSRQEVDHVLARRRLACHLVMAVDHNAEGHIATLLRDMRRWMGWIGRRAAWRAACMEYFRHYLDFAARKELVFFHHVSKSGGTTMCDNAFLNGCRPPSTPKTPPEAEDQIPQKKTDIHRPGDPAADAVVNTTARYQNTSNRSLADQLVDNSVSQERGTTLNQSQPHPSLDKNRQLLSTSLLLGMLGLGFQSREDWVPSEDVFPSHSRLEVGNITSVTQQNGTGHRTEGNVMDGHGEPIRQVRGVNCFAHTLLDGYIWRKARPRGLTIATSNNATAPSPAVYHNVTCRQRKEFARRYDLNFLSNENYLTEPMGNIECKTGILSFHILRDPHQRIVSHLHHLLDKGDCKRIPTQCIPNFTNKSLDELCSPTLTFVDRWNRVDITCMMETFFVISNDYFTRTLGGLASFTRERNGVREEDFNQAVSNLLNFDILIVLGHKIQTSIEKIMIGFPFTMPAASNSREYSTNTLSATQEAMVFESNRYDRRLYEIGQALNSLDVIVLLAAQSFCGETHLPPPYNKVDVWRKSKICEAFKSKPVGPDPNGWAELKGRYEIQRRFFTIKKREFHCGCGWAGAEQTRRKIKPFLPSLLKVNATQRCPREGVYL